MADDITPSQIDSTLPPPPIILDDPDYNHARHPNQIKKALLGLIPILILTLGLISARQLVTQNQDIRQQAQTVSTTLTEINTAIGGTVSYTGSTSNLSIHKFANGIYSVLANNFNCTPGITNCEPDRYEIRFPSANSIGPVYGLGMLSSAGKVEVDDFLDTNFGPGHILTPTDHYNPDIGRLRTPVFVIPQQKVIIAYLQPAVKMLRLTRDGTLDCPSGQACFILKKHHLYNEGQPGRLLVIKADSVEQLYTLYRTALEQHLGLYFKKPHFQVFGVNWETAGEFACTPTLTGVTSAFNNYWTYTSPSTGQNYDMNIRPSTFTVGSGYWGGFDLNGDGTISNNEENVSGCGLPPTDMPTTDMLRSSPTRFNGYTGLNQFFSTITGFGSYPIIGMRHNIALTPAYTSSADTEIRPGNVTRIRNAYTAKGISESQIFLHPTPHVYYGGAPSNNVYVLNTHNQSVINTWADLLRAGYSSSSTGYGNFKGLKEDEMLISDQFGYRNWLATKGITINPTANFPDDTVRQVYKYYNQKYSDFIIFGRNDWFSVGTDAQNSQGWVSSQNSGFNGYIYKDMIDSILSQVVSGYPHPNLEFYLPKDTNGNFNHKEFIRAYQLATFLPITMHSDGFWHLTNHGDLSRFTYSSKLRQRLHQYAYDQAMTWWDTGVPTAMQPLYLKYPLNPSIRAMYNGTTATQPLNQFFFGNALMVRPIVSSSDTFSVYYPPGTWITLLKESTPLTTNGTTASYTLSGTNDYPVFLKQGELLIMADPANLSQLQAYINLPAGSSATSSIYTLYDPKGPSYRLQAYRDSAGNIRVKNNYTGYSVSTFVNPYNAHVMIANINTLLNNNTPPITPTKSPTPTTPPAQPGDTDNDLDVDIFDYLNKLNPFTSILNLHSTYTNYGTRILSPTPIPPTVTPTRTPTPSKTPTPVPPTPTRTPTPTPRNVVKQTALLSGGQDITYRYQNASGVWGPWCNPCDFGNLRSLIPGQGTNQSFRSYNHTRLINDSNKMKISVLTADGRKYYYQYGTWNGTAYANWTAWTDQFGSLADIPTAGSNLQFLSFDEEVLTYQSPHQVKQAVLKTNGISTYYRYATWNGTAYANWTTWVDTYGALDLPTNITAISLDHNQELNGDVSQYVIAADGRTLYKRTRPAAGPGFGSWSTQSLNTLIPQYSSSQTYRGFDVTTLP